MGHHDPSHATELCRLLPADAGRIAALAERDCRFSAICRDVGEAVRAKARWERDNQGRAGRVAEYQHLIEELCDEALDYLNSTDPDPP